MTTLSQEEFNQRSNSGTNSLEKIYQGKTLEAGPVFSRANIQAAKLYCQRFSRKRTGAICIIVEELSFLRIWSETFEAEQNVSNKASSLESETKTSIDGNSSPVEAEFTDFCQKILAEYIGPIAPRICKKTLAKKPNLSRTEFVEILAKKIPDPIQAQEFQQAVLD